MKRIYRSTLESLLTEDEIFFKAKENADLAAINYIRENEAIEVDLDFRDGWEIEQPSLTIEEVF